MKVTICGVNETMVTLYVGKNVHYIDTEFFPFQQRIVCSSFPVSVQSEFRQLELLDTKETDSRHDVHLGSDQLPLISFLLFLVFISLFLLFPEPSLSLFFLLLPLILLIVFILFHRKYKRNVTFVKEVVKVKYEWNKTTISYIIIVCVKCLLLFPWLNGLFLMYRSILVSVLILDPEG